VDDEPFNVDGIQIILQCLFGSSSEFKDRVDTACDGEEAVEMV